MTTILVCDADAGCAREVAKAATSLAETQVLYLAGLTEAIKHAREGSSAVLMVGPSIVAEEAFVAIRTLRETDCRASVILIAEQMSQDLLRQAMKAGVDDVLPKDASAGEMVASLRDAIAKAARRDAARHDTDERPRGEVVTVFSTKGGVGKTVVSTNIAVALAQLGKSTVLMDLDLQFGDVGIVLGLEPTQTVIGAVNSGERLDAEMLNGFLVEHVSGLRVLLAPTQPEDAEMVTASRIDRIIALLQSMFDYVVIDTPPSLDESTLTALDRSDRVIAITMMDVASVKNSRVSLQKLAQLGYNGALVEVMLNRADSKVYLQPEAVEQAIGLPIKYRLPSDQQIPRSVNKGVPVVMEAPRSQPAKVLLSAARAIVTAHEGVPSNVT